MKEVKIDITIYCQMYNQKQCRGFIEKPEPHLHYCIYGTPDRPCSNHDICQEAMLEYFCTWRDSIRRKDDG